MARRRRRGLSYGRIPLNTGTNALVVRGEVCSDVVEDFPRAMDPMGFIRCFESRLFSAAIVGTGDKGGGMLDG